MPVKDYKETLILPKTEIPMKANLKDKDSYYFKLWKNIDLYNKVLSKNKGKKTFVLHDGPPYANGSLHIGHALNKILKDMVIRYKSLNGFYTPFVPGWDTHGLPIENKMLAEAKKSHKDLEIIKLRKEAEIYANSQIEIQKKQFQSLNLLSNFEKIYKTINPKYEAKQLEIFKSLALDGLVYRGLKPVYWSPSSQSALAEAEIEYLDHRSPSIYVSFKVCEANSKILKNDNVVIWTTTPWTLLANSAVAISKDITYVRVKANNQIYIVAKDLVEKLSVELKWEHFEIISELKHKDFEGIKYKSPLNNLICPIVIGHHVTLESGSGLVHIAPMFGEDDFIIGKKENLEMIMHVADDGTFNEKAVMFSGMFYEDANKEVGMFLDSKSNLLSLKFIKHSYPHDWRTNKPIIFRGTPQWFVSIKDIKNNIIKELEKVKFYNDWSKKRIKLMIQNRDEWTISRQRSWGVPIIIFYDENKEPVIKEEIFDYVISLVREKGTNIWYELDTDNLLPKKYRNKGWTKENDIMDVWFDSGSSFYAAEIDNNLKPPYDLYLEGSDQYRGWFNSSLINSVAFLKTTPYKSLISHGFVLDQKGNKMSKSKNNVVDPQKIINQYGSDILRLWVANSEYVSDVTIGDTIIKQNVEIYRKIRNTLRHMIGSLNDYDFSKPKKSKLDLLIDEQLENLKIKIKKNYDNYNFITIIKEINNFITYLSSFYLSVIKDTLYLDHKNSKNRRSIQGMLYKIVDTLLISLAPIMPTTIEEIYSFFRKEKKLESIHLEKFYDIKQEESFNEQEQWKDFFLLKDQIYKEIENKIKDGSIKRSNEAFIKAPITNPFYKLINLNNLLMIGKIENNKNVEVTTFDSLKCSRCWNHFEKKDMVEDICKRCFEVVKQ